MLILGEKVAKKKEKESYINYPMYVELESEFTHGLLSHGFMALKILS